MIRPIGLLALLSSLMLFMACPPVNPGPGGGGDDDDDTTPSESDETASETPVIGDCYLHSTPAADGTNLYLDVFSTPVLNGDVIAVTVDNTAAEAGDPIALIFDGGGNFVGQFDDDMDCTTPTFDPGYGCPQGEYTATADDPAMAVGVGNWSGSADPVSYCVTVTVNGIELDLTTPTAEDQPIPL